MDHSLIAGPIVQPDWAINPEINLFQDYNVRVTNEKLEETEAIRDYIQETVDNGTYVVELDEEDFEEEEMQAFEETPGVDLSHPEPEHEVESTTKNIPATKPEPHPNPEPKPVPAIKPVQEPPQPRTPSESQRKSKSPPKSFASPSGGRLFIWLRKRFNRS
ncbi:protein TsetseEP-like isoform X2 [Episyrphus balteatus]|uniref:protein TsetseEP-like isoform X2 n=1 Tax=Episyrphus balteatus TaxID=286459 RepID=UPI002485EF07|nr:protein TsetseEP-like isoform X2 [Episyrphus balteatus]